MKEKIIKEIVLRKLSAYHPHYSNFPMQGWCEYKCHGKG